MSGNLRWILVCAAINLVAIFRVEAQTTYNIVFYNVENLFDTWDDPETSDEEFTPANEKHWTRERFADKIKMIYKTLITTGNGQFPDIIGLAEVENRWVCEQLISKTPLSKVPYQIIHKESPDFRGIDVALIYRTDKVKPIDYDHIPVSAEGKHLFKSRDILYFAAELENEKFHFFVNHWPSRSGGYIETKEKREITARLLRNYLDSLMCKDRDANILLMGDFNAAPYEKCITEILSAFPYPGNNNSAGLINLSTLWTQKADGTIRVGGRWEIFDQMICSAHLLSNDTFKIEFGKSGICNYDFLLESDPTWLGKKPFRTYLGPKYHSGISDHLPVKICISTKQH